MPKKKKKTWKDYGWKQGSVEVGKKPDGSPDRRYFYYKTEDEKVDKRREKLREATEQSTVSEDMTVQQWGYKWLKAYKGIDAALYDIVRARRDDVRKAKTALKAAKNSGSAEDVKFAQKMLASAQVAVKAAEAAMGKRPTNSQTHYERKVRKNIVPHIGDMRMRDVRRSDIISLMDNYEGCKFDFVDKIRQAVQQLFRDAVTEGVIQANPADKVALPEHDPRSQRRPFTDIERKIFLIVAALHRCGVFFLTLLYCGPRPEECIALLRSDVDFERKRLSITKSWSFTNTYKGESAGTKAANMLKAKRKLKKLPDGDTTGHREVPIPDVFLPILAEHCKNLKPNDLLFPKSTGGYATAQTLRDWWRSYKRQMHLTAGAKTYRNAILTETSPIGDDVVPYCARHTYGQDMLAAKVDHFVRQHFLGHAKDKNVTSRYTTMSETAFKESARQLNSLHKRQNVVKDVVTNKKQGLKPCNRNELNCIE